MPPGGVQTKAAILALHDDTVPADTHGVTYSGQTVRQSSDLFVGGNEELGPSVPNGAEFHQGLIIECRIEADRHELGLVLVDEKHAPEQDTLGIEGWICWPVGTDVMGRQLLLP